MHVGRAVVVKHCPLMLLQLLLLMLRSACACNHAGHRRRAVVNRAGAGIHVPVYVQGDSRRHLDVERGEPVIHELDLCGIIYTRYFSDINKKKGTRRKMLADEESMVMMRRAAVMIDR